MPLASLLLLFASLGIPTVHGAAPDPARLALSWLAPTDFGGSPITNYEDSMPLGNGRVVALAWANYSTGGLDFYLRSAQALHSDTTVFTIARGAIALSPNFCATPGAYFNQTLHLEDASVSVLCGGTSLADYTVALKIFVDAAADAVVVTAAARDGVTPFSLTASLTSVRPDTRFSFNLDFMCSGSSSGADVLLAPLPSPAPANSLGLYHVNDVASGDSSLFNETMYQQGLAPLLANFSDPLDGRIFGAGMTGGAGVDGAGTPLQRTSNSTMASAAPGPAFALLIAVRVDPHAGGDTGAWTGALAAALGTPIAPAQRAAGNAAHWGAFWAKSYVSVNSPDPPPPPPPQPPRNNTVGSFPCGGDLRERQVMTMDAATGALTLPLGLCLEAPYNDWVRAVPCNANNSAPWVVTPCLASNCNPAEDFWVMNPATFPNPNKNWTRNVFGFQGSSCPWILAWTPDNPAGGCLNEVYYFNSTDSTLRTKCCSCQEACLTVQHTYPPPPPPPAISVITTQYAYTRFINAVQGGGGVDAPIPFNGMLFTNLAGSSVDYRQWGNNHWFQNTRFPYETMLPAGDVENMRVVLDWTASFIPLASARTELLLPGESGIFFTETVNTFGLYQGPEYDGCDPKREEGYPRWLEGPGGEGGWVRYDFGGNGFAEAGLMGIDYYWHTLDLENSARYIPFATSYVDFYASHFPNRTQDGRLMIWPSQVLESWWCEWPASPSVNFDPTKCCQNDLPNVAALRSLVQRLLGLPLESGLLTPAQRDRYTALSAILPELPLDPKDGTYAAAQVLSSDAGHNSEGPWLFGTHPYRLNTVGAAIASPSTVNLTASRATWVRQTWNTGNSGWSYGTINTAMLGFSAQAYAMVLDRARAAPPGGYRFPAFAEHYQDYEPSADHFSVMNTALHAMLLQNGEDDAKGTIVLLPAWPCEVDVSFKLWGVLNTSVEVVWANGTLVSLTVVPPERASSVVFAPCNTTVSRHTSAITNDMPRGGRHSRVGRGSV